MDAHATSQSTVQFMTLSLITRDSDAERGIGKGFFHSTDEFDYVL